MQSRVEVGTQVTLSPVFRRVNIRAEMVAAKGCGKLPWSGWLRWLVQCRCNAQLPPPSPGPMFQSATTTNPFFQTLAKRRFQRNFSRAERCYLLLRPSRNTVGKIERFFEISKHTSGSPLTSTPREKSFLLCNFEFSRIFSSLLREIFFER